MIRIGTPVIYPADEVVSDTGTVERNSMRTGRHLVRVNDRWFDRKDIRTESQHRAWTGA